MNKKSKDDAQREVDEIKERLLKELGMNPPKESPEKPTITEAKSKFNLEPQQISSALKNLAAILLNASKKIQKLVSSISKSFVENIKNLDFKSFKSSLSLKNFKNQIKNLKNFDFKTLFKGQPGSVNVKLISAGLILVICSVLIFIKFDLVKVTQGIETTRGTAASKTFLVINSDDFKQNDLVVAQLPGASKDDLLIGTIFSQNEEFYALYDGEVIWQVAHKDVIGKVLFSDATQTP